MTISAALPLATVALVGCTAQRIVRLSPPVRAEVPSELSSVDVVLHDFSVNASMAPDGHNRSIDPSQAKRVSQLRQQFLTYLRNRAGFAKVLDPAVAPSRDPYALRLDVHVEARVQTSRTWALDFLALVTLGLWPVEPQWGRGDVQVAASLRDARGNQVWHTAVHEATPYTLIFFSFYRTHAIEEALRKSYERAFVRCADALAASHDTLVAEVKNQRALGTATPSPDQ